MKRASLLFLVASVPIFALAAPAPKDQLATWGKPVDPAKDCKFDAKDGKLKITVPGGKEPHDLSAELNAPMDRPLRVLKEIEGDFQLEVTLAAFAVPEGTAGGTERNVAFWGAGFLVWQDDKNYVRLERAMFRRDEQAPCYISFELRKNGEFVKYGSPDDGNLDPKKGAMLRLKRKGNVISASVSEDAGKTWNELKVLEVEMGKKLQAGVVAVNTSKADFAPEFEKYSIVGAKDDAPKKK